MNIVTKYFNLFTDLRLVQAENVSGRLCLRQPGGLLRRHCILKENDEVEPLGASTAQHYQKEAGGRLASQERRRGARRKEWSRPEDKPPARGR